MEWAAAASSWHAWIGGFVGSYMEWVAAVFSWHATMVNIVGSYMDLVAAVFLAALKIAFFEDFTRFVCVFRVEFVKRYKIRLWMLR